MFSFISEARLSILKKLGFTDVPDCDPSYAFGTQAMALDAQMFVEGDHDTDCAYIYYACVTDKDKTLDGLFYAPSLLEYMPVFANSEWRFDAILSDICETISCEASVPSIGGFPMIFIPTDEYDFSKGECLRFPLSDMRKLIGIMDYFLSRERMRFMRKGNVSTEE